MGRHRLQRCFGNAWLQPLPHRSIQHRGHMGHNSGTFDVLQMTGYLLSTFSGAGG